MAEGRARREYPAGIGAVPASRRLPVDAVSSFIADKIIADKIIANTIIVNEIVAPKIPHLGS